MTLSHSNLRIVTMEERDRLLIWKLRQSFSDQLTLYKKLRDTVRIILSRLILSRGDVSGLMCELEEKNKLIEAIQNKRAANADRIKLWQERKSNYPGNKEVMELEVLLEEMETVIREFLDEEDKLKIYLEKVFEKNAGGGP